MKIKELLKMTYWGAKELSLVTGMSENASRELLRKIRNQITENGFLNINKTKAPVKRIVEQLDIDIDWLIETGAIDQDVSLLKKSER